MIKRTQTLSLVCCLLLLYKPSSAQTPSEVKYRPAFHFSPLRNWTNDPNGLVYYGGKYHLFFQYNPFGDLWGHMSWGHAVSTDLMKWEEQPIALQDYDNGNGTTTMFFSGTAVNDKKNTSGFGSNGKTPLVAIYTAHIDSVGKGISQSQAMAYSLDGIHFSRYDKNPLIDLHTKAFRDPKVFWHKASGKWVMIVARPTDYILQFYGSSDLKTWTLLSNFGEGLGDRSKIWECPDIFEIPVKNRPGVTKWVITVSGGHPQQNSYVGMQYFTGAFDGKQFVADKQDSPQYIDYGKDFYAGIVYNDLPIVDKRIIMIGWANSWVYARNIPAHGSRGQMSIPRELSLYKEPNGALTLASYPVKEVNTYHDKMIFSAPVMEVSKSKPLAKAGKLLDIQFTLVPGKAGKAGIRLLKQGDQETLVYYNKTDNCIKLDRTKSGITDFSTKFPGIESAPLPTGSTGISVRILVDNNLVEVFINGGKQVISDLVFPSGENPDAEWFSDGGKVIFKNIKVWTMKASMPPTH